MKFYGVGGLYTDLIYQLDKYKWSICKMEIQVFKLWNFIRRKGLESSDKS